MALKVKISKIGFKDIGKFGTLAQARDKVINAAPAKEVSGVFPINKNAAALHPDFQKMKIAEVIEHEGAGAKTFILRADKAAYFRAGQYLSVYLEIGESKLTRPYSISSSPEWSKDGKYAITVRRTPNGFASDWILDNWKVGDEVTVSDGLGNFYYEELRDSENVIALAGGSGITPFLSMAYAIRDGIESFNLTILFGSRDENSILFKEELDAISAECDKVKVVHVLSEQKKKGYEHGFINADIIRKYAPENGDYSVFLCGPEAMYKFAEGEIEKLGLERKYVRRELLGVTKKVWEKADYPDGNKGKTFTVTVRQGENETVISASADEPVLVALERSGISAPSRCRSGECGWCRSKLISGEVYVPEENDDGRRWSDKENGYIHPCASFALSDLVLEVPGSYIK